jgi:hypothetical protein
MRSRVLAAAALALAACAASGAELVDRILAVVDTRPVFLSDVKAVEALDGRTRAEALERTIDEMLLFQEAFRLPQAAASEEEVRAVADSALPAIRRAARRRAVVQKYIAFRFRPQVRIDEDEVRRAYAAQWEGRPDAPSPQTAEAELRDRLVEAEVAARVAAWLKDLRAAAQIRYNAPE